MSNQKIRKKMKISIVGGGNMGGAIANGLLSACVLGNNLELTVINKSKAKGFIAPVKEVLNDYTSLKKADIIIIAVKPWMFAKIANIINESISSSDKKIIVSVVAGITLDDMHSLIKNKSVSLFRVMPNTAIAFQESMTFVSSKKYDENELNQVLSLFTKLGEVEFIEEKQFAAATSISGCGIAFALRYIRASVEGGVELGLPVNLATKGVLQAMKGAITVLEKKNSHPEVEIDKVTTPGGLTIKGLNAMEAHQFTTAVIEGLKASYL